MSLTMPAIERSKVVRYSKTYAVLLPLVAPLVAALYAGWWEPWGPGGFAGGGDPALRPDGGGVTPGLRLAMGVCVLLAVATAVWYPRDGLLHGLLLHACTLLAFLGSMMWMNAAADELVGLLVAVGNIMELPPALLGATVLAWGNSLSDAVSNTTMARDGYPTMAITACFASPLFILLAGVACTLSYGARTGAMAMPQDLPTLTLFATSCLNIIMWALLVPFVFKFKLDRRITFIGMAFYATFQVVFVTIVLRQA
ncbi:Sodium/calcium exchanger protein-domain-containing protein, partial [Haematococcus lacustris]